MIAASTVLSLVECYLPYYMKNSRRFMMLKAFFKVTATPVITIGLKKQICEVGHRVARDRTKSAAMWQ